MKKIILIITIMFTQQVLASIDVNVLGMGEQVVVGYDEYGMNDAKKLTKKVNNFNELAELANDNDTWAQLRMGDLLYFGNGLVRNEELAIKYWESACKSRESEGKPKWQALANFRLGKYHLKSEPGISRSHLERAAKLGHAEAQMIIFVLESKGNSYV